MESQTTQTLTKGHGSECSETYCYCYDSDLGDPICECGNVAWLCSCESYEIKPLQFDKNELEEIAKSIDTGLDIKERHLRRLIARYQAVRDVFKGDDYEPNLRKMVRTFYGKTPMRITWEHALAQWGFQDLLVIMREELLLRK